MMELRARVELINSKEELAEFVVALREDLLAMPDEWENPTLEAFLEAMSAWILAMDNVYRNSGGEMPKSPSWKTFANILYASKIYE